VVQFLAGAIVGSFSLRHRIQTGPLSHPVSHPMGTGDPYPGGKTAETWSLPHISI